MSSMIYSSAHHARAVELFKNRLRAGTAVDAMDDTGRWVRARIVQMDERWGKCKIQWDGVSSTQEEWIALDRDRLRPLGEMTHAAGPGAGHYGASRSASYSAHTAYARQLRKEAVILWLLAAVLIVTGVLWSDGLAFYALLFVAAWTVWFGAIPRTLSSLGEGIKANFSDRRLAGSGADTLFQKVQFWWWLRSGVRVDFLNRSNRWVIGKVLTFPFPWHKARVEYQGSSGKDTVEWIYISEQRLIYPGQMTAAQEHQHRSATPQGELSGTISSVLLERAQRSANADPRGHTPTSTRLDGQRDGGGYADSPSFSMTGAISPGFDTSFAPFAGGPGVGSPIPGTPGGPIRSPAPSPGGAFGAQQSPMHSFASPSGLRSPASALGATLNASGIGARVFDDITNEAELQQYEESHPLESTIRRASLATSPGRTDGTPWGRSPSPVRSSSLQRSSIGGIDGYANVGGAIQEYHAGENHTKQHEPPGRANRSGTSTRHAMESPSDLIPRLAREWQPRAGSHQPSPWSRNPQEDILRWSWQVQRWLEINLVQFVGRTLFEQEFLTMARGPNHAKAKALFCEEVREAFDTQNGTRVPSEFNLLWNSDQALHQVKGIGELTIQELMRQQAPANTLPGMGGMLQNAGGMLMGRTRKSTLGSSGGDESLLDYICLRLPKQGKRLRELQRQQHFLDSHGLSDSKDRRAVFIVQRLKSLGTLSVPASLLPFGLRSSPGQLSFNCNCNSFTSQAVPLVFDAAHCANVWDTRHASCYCWNGGFHNNHKWTLPNRPDQNFPTDAEILFELFLSKESQAPLDAARDTIGRHVVDNNSAAEEDLRRRGNLAGGGGFLRTMSNEQGLQLSVIAPKGSPNSALPVWQVPPGQGNLPAAIALFVYYMTYVDDELGERGVWLPNAEQQRAASGPGSSSSGTTSASAAASDGEQGLCYLLGIEGAGGSSWGLLRREIFNGLMLNNGPRDPRMDGMAASLSDAELQQRLGAREAARHAGDFEQAERLLDQLRVRGVWLDDATERWTTCDGRAGLYPTASAAGLLHAP